MNYLKELALFYNRIDSQDLPANAILLWYTLMGISNSLYWKENVPITLSQIESKSKLSKPTIWRMRKLLIERGLLRYNSNAGRNCGTYKLLSIEQSLAFQCESITETDSDLAFQSESITETQNDLPFHSESITETQNDFAFQSESITENIHKHKTYITNKENIKRKNLNEISVGAEAPPTSKNPTPERKEKSCAKKEKNRRTKQEQSEFTHYALQEGGRPKVKVTPPLCDFEKWLEGVELPWADVMRKWLGYKASRKERYKSEVSMETCLKQLKKFSAGDPKVAQEVVDQSIANNWAGLFELKRQPYYARGQPMPAQGQHIGQIKQPKDEEARQKILDKFKPQPIKHKP